MLLAPGEAAADDAFDDEVVGGCCGTEADAEVDLPPGRDVEVGDDEELLLLVVEGVEAADASVVGVVFEASVDFFGEVVADLCAGSEGETLMDVGAVQGSFEGGVEGEVPAAEGLVDDGAYLPGPGVGGVDGALVADLGGEADADGPVPGGGDADAGTDVVADPLDTVAVLGAGEDVEAEFGPVVDALSEFEGLVLLVVGGVDAVDGVLLAVRGEVGVDFDHGAFGFDGVGAVDLDLVVALCGCWSREEQEAGDEEQKEEGELVGMERGRCLGMRHGRVLRSSLQGLQRLRWQMGKVPGVGRWLGQSGGGAG